MASDTGGRRVLSRHLHSSISGKANSTGFSYFRIYNGKSLRPFFHHPPWGSPGIASPAALQVLGGGEGMWIYSPIPRARDTPCFSATPWYTPLPIPGSRATPAAETTAPALELLNRPQPAGANNRNCPDRERKYTESTQQQPKLSRRNENI